jgi:hypothetical protein
MLLAARELSAAEPLPVLPVDGASYTARLVSVDSNWQITLEQDNEKRSLPARDLVTLGSFRDPSRGPQILLADGSLIIADLVKSEGDTLIVDSVLLGELKLPLEALRGIVLHPPTDPQRRDRLLARLSGTSGDYDLLILDNADELTGTILTLSPEQIELESKVGKVPVDSARVAAILFNPTLVERIKPTGLRALAGLSDGSRLLASSLEVDSAKLRAQSPLKLDWKTKAEHLRALQVFGGRAEYLSDLKPAGYKHIPFLDLSWPYHLDANCLGTRLRCGGAVYQKGIGMHSASRLTFPLSGQKRFAAEACVDSHTAGRGSVVFRVFADSEQLYASEIIRGDMPPVPISVDLPEGAKSLSLIVDFAERGDELDHANWLNARLLSGE